MSEDHTNMVATVSFGRRRPNLLPSRSFSRADYEKFLTPMTHIFRANFWSTFSKADVFEPAKKTLNVFGLKADISDVVVLHSSEQDFDGIEAEDFVVSFVLTFDASLEELKDAKSQALSSNNTSDYYLSVLDDATEDGFTKAFYCEAPSIPGVSSHFFCAEPAAVDLSVAAALGAYFHYGWIILLRLERAQMDLRISDSSDDIFYSSDDIIQQRVRLINIKRRFLTHDRTNDGGLKKICSDYRAKFKMDDRFSSLNTIHEFFEHHLDNTSKVVQAQRTRALSKALNLLTFLAVPLGIIGTILAIDLQGSFLMSPTSVYRNPVLWFLIGGTFGAVLALIIIARMFDIFLSKKR